MSVGNNLQKMENIEENAVTKGAKPSEPMQKLSTGGTPATWEDLGGPTPENYKSDDDSAKLKHLVLHLIKVQNLLKEQKVLRRKRKRNLQIKLYLKKKLQKKK